MKLPIHYALALLTGLSVGSVAAGGPKAEGRSPAYYVAHIELTDDSNAFVDNYGSEVGWTLAPFGGRVLVRGTSAIHLEGDQPRTRNAVIQFDSMERAQAWYYSYAYQMLIPIRQLYAKTNAYLVEGVPQ